jgi:hypothetical protein
VRLLFFRVGEICLSVWACSASPVGLRKTSAPALHFPPTARGPFVPQSPSATRARSADAGFGGSMLATAAASVIHLHGHGPGTPQLVNQVLPGTLPGTPQTTASATPVIPGLALPSLNVEGAGEFSCAYLMEEMKNADYLSINRFRVAKRRRLWCWSQSSRAAAGQTYRRRCRGRRRGRRGRRRPDRYG